MSTEPVLIQFTPQGGTIHQFKVNAGERFLGCYLGTCKFSNNLDDALADLDRIQPTSPVS